MNEDTKNDTEHAYQCPSCGSHTVDIDQGGAWCHQCHALVADERPKNQQKHPLVYRPLGDWRRIVNEGCPVHAAPTCKCGIREKLVGDGCSVCNPEYVAEHGDEEPPARYTLAEALRALHDLAIRPHDTCDDPFYSCPATRVRPQACNCGAAEHNAEVEDLFTRVTLLLSESDI